MPEVSHMASPKGLLCAAFGLVFVLLASAVPCAAATLHVHWASNSEADLAGYRLRYGTSPGTYTETIETGRTTFCEVTDLEPGTLYYFSLTAFDQAGNESAPSAEVTARIPVSLAPIPSIAAANETTTLSAYLVQSRTSFAIVYGQNLASGATVDLGPGVTVERVVRGTAGALMLTLDIDPGAPLGSRTLTVTNPDLGTGSRSDALSIVRSPDIDGSCVVDVLDLNDFARSWNEASDDSQYIPSADFDGDGYVGPDDLTIFVQYFGRAFSGCP
jgi:fibronectin type III domain protein/quinohemoprotein amine dehydrogenase alpha subunit-like protein